jgi:poly(A) polymerase Pap1
MVHEHSLIDGAQLANSRDQAIVEHHRAAVMLSDSTDLISTLEAHRMFPNENEVQLRRDAFDCIKTIVLGESSNNASSTSDIPMVFVPVGSYGLGVWTSESDIDCLCIGTISSRTFFKLARQRLLRADGQDVRILRKVEANTGTMLELSVNGIAMDLQYCSAARVVER